MFRLVLYFSNIRRVSGKGAGGYRVSFPPIRPGEDAESRPEATVTMAPARWVVREVTV
jgi:hypothetical protein